MMISIEAVENMIRVTLTDWGVPLKPSDIRPFDIEAPIETRIKGGMGLHFINTLMDSVTRITADTLGEPNMLILTKRTERRQPGAPRISTTQELNAVLSISQVMATSFDLDWLLERIVSELVKVIDAEGGTLYLIDEERGELFSYVLMEEEDKLHEIRVKIGEGIAGQVAATGEILNIKDASKHPSFNRSFDDMTGYKTRTMLVAPMRDRYEKIIGVVQLVNKRGRRFTSHDERLLSASRTCAYITRKWSKKSRTGS
jgi:putative methionine-R-sulfoxide reductase with GAF domain